MSAGDPRSPSGWSPAKTHPPAARFFRLSQLRQMRGNEQVAAVCYRVRGQGIEFLLVQTRGGRWTFPKGNAEPGLTHAQAAALEAFEEAGVHGRMEEASFARYVRRQAGRSTQSPADKELAVHAHLCEVRRLGAPQESGRNPSWFAAEKTKRRLREARTPDDAAELARVVDRAVTRIQRLRRLTSAAADRPRLDGTEFDRPRLDRPKKDGLRKVHVMVEHAGERTGTGEASATRRKKPRNVVPIDRF